MVYKKLIKCSRNLHKVLNKIKHLIFKIESLKTIIKQNGTTKAVYSFIKKLDTG